MRVERTECERDFQTIVVEGFEGRLKLRRRPNYPGASPFGPQDVSPEYEDLVPLAEARGWSLREAERRVLEVWQTK